ncbi:MAG: site-2 protease family protein [Oscillospiraceae bacterium]|nr:site-2 protease family protein [Oscillospiraceae bacterium]
MSLIENSRLFELLIHALIVFTAFPVHECAHAWAADRLGDDTAKKQGRLTLNPFKHLDVLGTLFMLFADFGWAKPVPVDPRKFKNPKNGMALSSLAGPASNLVMAYIAMVIFRILYAVLMSSAGTETLYNISYIFSMIVYLNVALAVFNLLPVPPLDGSRIFNLFMSESTYFKVMKYERYIQIALMFAVYMGVLDVPLYYLRTWTIDIMFILTDWVDAVMKIII